MIKAKMLIGVACAASLGLAGCGANSVITPTTVETALTQLEAEVTDAAKLACSVAPTAITIAGIVSANPALTTVSQIVGVICGAVGATATKTALAGGTFLKAARRLGAAPGQPVTVGTYVGPNGSVPIVVTYVGS